MVTHRWFTWMARVRADTMSRTQIRQTRARREAGRPRRRSAPALMLARISPAFSGSPGIDVDTVRVGLAS